MRSEEPELPVIYLKAGEVFFSGDPVIVLTVLGSCLAVTMFHRRSGFSAVSHGLLPQCEEQPCGMRCSHMARYVECSIRWMAAQFREVGASLCELEVKMFGGADMFAATPHRKGLISVGKLNIATALRVVREEGLRVTTSDTGGSDGRKIFFNTQTGEVLLKRLQSDVTLDQEALRER